ncbi:DUF805 domain-containing protein [Burkholderia sp. PU8-34]
MIARTPFSFRGRAGRMQWWCVTAALLGAGSVVDAIAAWPALQRSPAAVDVAGWAFAVVMVWMLAAVSARRWHDIGRSGWWTLVHAIPVVGAFIAIAANGFVAGEAGRNRYDSPSPGQQDKGASL